MTMLKVQEQDAVYAGKISDDGMRNIKGAACMKAKARDGHKTIVTCPSLHPFFTLCIYTFATPKGTNNDNDSSQ